MARGWESKSVEAQQEDRQRRDAPGGSPMTLEEGAAQARRRTLELARARAAADLAAARSPAHRAMLEAALEAIDEQLK